jgi:hypothetical protein
MPSAGLKLTRIRSRLQYLLRIAIANPSAVWSHSRYVVSGWLYPRYRRSVVILPCTGGVGDNLMLTTVAREVRKRNPSGLIHVIASHPEVFLRNPDVDFVSGKRKGGAPWRKHFPVRYNHGFPWKRHFLYKLCECLNMGEPIQLQTYVFPDQLDWAFAEKILAESAGPPILLARTVGGHDPVRKIWPLESWEMLASELTRIAPVLDVGVSGTPLTSPHPGYRSLLGQTTLHQLAALMSRSRALVTMDSSPNHLAAAFHLPTVCILGGVFPPESIRYPNTRVLSNRPACADCWPKPGCEFNLKCLRDITPKQVVTALAEICPDTATAYAKSDTSKIAGSSSMADQSFRPMWGEP